MQYDTTLGLRVLWLSTRSNRQGYFLVPRVGVQEWCSGLLVLSKRRETMYNELTIILPQKGEGECSQYFASGNTTPVQ